MSPSSHQAHRAWGGALGLTAGFAGMAVWLLNYPAFRVTIAGLLLTSSLLIAWRPVLIWALLPISLALFDLAPWSGRLYFDEMDAALCTWLAIGWWRCPRASGQPADMRLRLLSGALALVLAVGATKSLIPWPGIVADSFASLLSPFNGLRIVRGAVWAVLLLWLAMRQMSAGYPVHAMLANGMVAALAGVVLFIVGERLAFSALLDFNDGYRVSGPFSAMNTGGAYVECFLVSATPFLLTRLLVRHGIWRTLSLAVLLMATAYAVAVTFSRAGIAAWMIGVAVATGLCLRPACQRGMARAAWRIGIVVLLSVSVIVPVLWGPYGQGRVAAVERDLGARENHWRKLLALMPEDAWTWATGVGLGSFPVTNLMASPIEQRTATAGLVDQHGERFVRLGAGQPLYVEQFINLRSGTPALVKVRLRSAGPDSSGLTVSVCEKWLIASGKCTNLSFEAPPSAGAWISASQTIAGNALPSTVSGPPRPTKLAFSLRGGHPLDLASIELVQEGRAALLANPQFSQGFDHWYFTSDQHLAWHAKSMPLAVFFDLGVAGLLSFSAFLLLALGRSGMSAWRGSAEAAALFCALTGYLLIGSVDTLIDAPRFLLLLLLLGGLAAINPQRSVVEAGFSRVTRIQPRRPRSA